MKTLFLSFTLFLCCFQQTSFAQKLGSMEKQVSSSKSRSSSSSDGGHHSSSSVGFGEMFFFNIFIEPLFQLSYGLAFKFRDEPSPFLSPEASGRGLTEFPYNKSNFGAYYKDSVLRNRKSRFEVFGQYHSDKENIEGSYLRVKYAPIKAIGLEVNHLLLTETLDDNKIDVMQFSSFFVNYNRLRATNMNFWWGIGGLRMKRQKEYSNIAVNLGAEIYPFRPLSIYGSFQGTSLNETPVTISQLQVRLHINRVTPYVGYQKVRVGEISVESISVGLGVYF